MMLRVLDCLTTQHDWRLVVLAGGICLLASLTAVNLLHRAQGSEGYVRAVWIVTAGCTTGFGIWATHFVAMLAYDPGPAIGYHIGLTALSLAAAIAITCCGLVVALYATWPWGAALGGGIVGAGVAAMHYTGMSALELPGYVTWAPELVAASIGFGLVLGALALVIALGREGARASSVAALLLTLAIVSHHFTAMGAVTIIPDPTRVVAELSLSPTAVAFAVANAAIAILGMSLVGSIVDRRLRERDRRLVAAMNDLSQGVVVFDAQERLVVCNDRYYEMYGLSRDIVKPGCTLRDVIRSREAAGTLHCDPEQYRADLLNMQAHGKTFRVVVDQADGRAISIVNRRLAGGDWIGTHEDITEQRRAERELQRTKTFLDTIIESVPATIIVKDVPELRYVLVNRAGEKYFRMPRERMLGKTAAELFAPETAEIVTAQENEVLRTGENKTFEERTVTVQPGVSRIVTSHRLPIRGEDGKPKYMLGVIDDLTERKQAEARIAHLASHDSLTDLPNRSTFTGHLDAMLSRATTRNESFAVLCIDLDRFKEINDVFGHMIGDDAIKTVTQKLVAATPGAFLARVGGDEFAILVEGPQPATAEALGNRCLAAVADEIVANGQRLQIGLSVGVAIFPDDGRDATTLLGKADAALHRAKTDGRGSMRFFQADMDEQQREQRILQHELRSALAHNEFILHYQPQQQIGGEITGFEALVRWRHRTRGMVPPGMFIPAAEDSGFIVQIGDWVLREACREAASWPKPLQVAVNLSPVQFRHGDLAAMVHSVLMETGLPANRLELEITEGVLIGDLSHALSVLRRLKLLGVRIAMDDFGTGYSSLSYLQSFPFDRIKIDRSFISNVEKNEQSGAIVRAVIALAHGLRMPVVAEGVETRHQLEFLQREECNEVQGFLIGRPLPIRDYAELVGRPPEPLHAAG